MTEANAKKVQSEARLQWVPIAQMKVSPLAQRQLNQARVDRMLAELDLERIGHPTVSHRGEAFYIIDGQHRVEVLRSFGLGDTSLQCWTYIGMTEDQEAEAFLKLNDTLTVGGFDKFRVAVLAGRETECEINRVVMANGLKVSRDKDGIGAVGTLRRVYTRSDSKTLGRTLRLIRDSFGDSGFEAAVIDGLGLVCQRYNGELDEQEAVEKLKAMHGGVAGLMGKAGQEKRRLGCAMSHAVASAAVAVVNNGRRKKLADWFS